MLTKPFQPAGADCSYFIRRINAPTNDPCNLLSEFCFQYQQRVKPPSNADHQELVNTLPFPCTVTPVGIQTDKERKLKANSM